MKYYLEVESYKANSSVTAIRIVNQTTKNRREKLSSILKSMKVDFFEIDDEPYSRLNCSFYLSEASTKLIKIMIKEFYRINIK